MFERRPMLGLLIGLTLCVSIWRITMQEPSMIEAESGYMNQFQQQQQQQQAYQRQHTVEPQISSVIYTKIGTTLKNNIQKQQQQNNDDNRNDLNNNNNNNNNNLEDTSIGLVASHTSSQSQHYHRVFSSPSSSSMTLSPSNLNLYDELPKNDFSNLIDLHDFQFIINQLPCQSNFMNGEVDVGVDDDDSDIYKITNGNGVDDNIKTKNLHENNSEKQQNGPLVLILVHSAPTNYKKRLHIRETWGSLDTPLIRLIFLLGAVKDIKLQHKIELENNMFSDIVQGNFIDDYRNMTYKHVMALKWFLYYCPKSKFLLKIDDDVFVNTPYLIDYLNRFSKRSNLLFCETIYWSRVKRSYRSKWRVSTKEYPNRYYPPYCPGYSIIYSSDIILRLYNEAQKTSYFWIDDVHITGTIAQKCNITITSSASYILTKGLCEKILLNYENNLKSNNINNNHMKSMKNSILNSNENHNEKNSKNNNNNENNDLIINNIENFLFLFSWPDIEEQQARLLWKIIEKLR